MEFPFLFDIISFFGLIMAVAGAVLIIIGGIRAVIGLLLIGTGKSTAPQTSIRRDLTNTIVFGLEFLIAADILSTIIAPTQEELVSLAFVVVIRTVLGYFLSREAVEFKNQ